MVRECCSISGELYMMSSDSVVLIPQSTGNTGQRSSRGTFPVGWKQTWDQGHGIRNLSQLFYRISPISGLLQPVNVPPITSAGSAVGRLLSEDRQGGTTGFHPTTNSRTLADCDDCRYSGTKFCRMGASTLDETCSSLCYNAALHPVMRTWHTTYAKVPGRLRSAIALTASQPSFLGLDRPDSLR